VSIFLKSYYDYESAFYLYMYRFQWTRYPLMLFRECYCNISSVQQKIQYVLRRRKYATYLKIYTLLFVKNKQLWWIQHTAQTCYVGFYCMFYRGKYCSKLLRHFSNAEVQKTLSPTSKNPYKCSKQIFFTEIEVTINATKREGFYYIIYIILEL